MSESTRLSAADLDAEGATALPAKEVISLLDLNADVDLGLDLAAPVDLAVAANLNVAAPIEAAASANVLSFGSEATGVAQQQVLIDQGITGDAIADAPQDASVDQAEPAPAEAPAPADGAVQTGDLSSGNLLDVDLDIAADADVAAPIAGAVAANGNIAAPIDASVSANIGSVDSTATSVANQTAIIHQDLDGVTAQATAAQDADVTQ
jgi:hypothetical protein